MVFDGPGLVGGLGDPPKTPGVDKCHLGPTPKNHGVDRCHLVPNGDRDRRPGPAPVDSTVDSSSSSSSPSFIHTVW